MIENKMLLPEEIKDTKQLQMKSLVNFMKGLEYELVNDVFGSIHFESVDYENKGRRNISFINATALHNGNFIDWHGTRFREPYDFSEYKMVRAKAAKLVHICNLQYCKKTKFIKQTSDLVSFVSPNYYKYFIGSKHFPF